MNNFNTFQNSLWKVANVNRQIKNSVELSRKTRNSFKIKAFNKRMSHIYNPLRNYVADYFGNPIVYRAPNVSTLPTNGMLDTIIPSQVLCCFVANVQDLISSNRYILATIPISSIPAATTKIHLANLEWTSFQTRTGNEYENFPSFKYNPPDQTPLNELVTMTNEDDTKNYYKCVQLICKNIVVKTGMYRSYRNIMSFAGCLETYSCLVMM